MTAQPRRHLPAASAALPKQPPKHNPDVVRYLTAREMAARYGVHVISIFRWAADGTLPKGELIGRCRRWRSDLLEEFELERREVQSQSK